MQVTVHAAKTQLSKSIEAALRGEEVEIARGSKPVVRLVPVAAKPFVFDILSDELKRLGPNFFEPVDEADLTLRECGDPERP